MARATTIRVINACYHRNGCGGAGYHTIRFEHEGHELGAVVFDQSEHVAILDDAGDSWRCEDFEPELRAFIASPACEFMCWPRQYAANDR